MTSLITAGFDSASPADFLTQSQLIVTSMTGNPNFPEPWPAPVPPLATISADLAQYQALFNATRAGDRTRITQRNAARDTLASDLLLLRLYVETAGHGDAAKVATSGFPLRQRAPRAAAVVPAPPESFAIRQGPVSGTMSLRCKAVTGAGCYEVQLASADPTVPGNWTEAGLFTSCRNISIQGLTPGKTYSVRMRAIGVAGAGDWTSPASIIVI